MSGGGPDILQACEVVVPFRGERDYVHSTSIVNLLMPFLGPTKAVSYRFSRLTGCNRLKALFLSATAESPSGALFDAWWTWTDDTSAKVAFLEGGPSVPEARAPYPEEEVIAGWQLLDNAAYLAVGRNVGFTLADRVVALNKALLSNLFPLGRNQRFLATRLDWQGPLSPLGDVRLECHKVIGGTHYASRFWLDDAYAGLVHFARQTL
jgi:hypothetical protein